MVGRRRPPGRGDLTCGGVLDTGGGDRHREQKAEGVGDRTAVPWRKPHSVVAARCRAPSVPTGLRRFTRYHTAITNWAHSPGPVGPDLQFRAPTGMGGRSWMVVTTCAMWYPERRPGRVRGRRRGRQPGAAGSSHSPDHATDSLTRSLHPGQEEPSEHGRRPCPKQALRRSEPQRGDDVDHRVPRLAVAHRDLLVRMRCLARDQGRGLLARRSGVAGWARTAHSRLARSQISQQPL